MLSLQHVTYRYAGARGPSLHDVSLELGAGEVLGVVGASEAGKTTLCLVASGLAPRTVGGTLSGQILLDGADTVALPMHRLAERIGIAFANPANGLSGVAGTVYEEIAFGPMNLGLQRGEVIARTEESLGMLGISGLAERDPSRLSGGQQQLVAIGGLLAMRPAHLILDEPTAQLDPAGTRLVADALARLAAGGASILLTEHKTDLLAGICTRVIALEGGRVVLTGDAHEVLADPRLKDLGVAAPAAVRLLSAAREAVLPVSVRERLAAALR